MVTRFRRYGTVLPVLACCALAPAEALAAPPGEWSIAIERIFGLRRVREERETPGGDTTIRWNSVSLGSELSHNGGYSMARLAVDFLAISGLTVGGALGYQSEGYGDDDDSWWLFAGRIGYMASAGNSVSIWPRAGLTYVSLGDNDTDATALTLEVPVVIHAMGRRLGFTLLPHADIGIGGEIDGFDRTVTEFGLEFGINAFF